MDADLHVRAAGNNELENMELSLEVTRAWAQGRYIDVLNRWTGLHGQSRYLPAAADTLFGLGWLVTGREFISVRKVNSPALVMLLLAFYMLARERFGRGYALLAVFLLAGIPLVTITSRFVNPKPLAAAALTVAIWALLRSRALTDLRYAALTGALAGLAMLCERGLPPVILAGPFAYEIGRGMLRPAEPGDRNKTLKGLVLLAVAALIVAGPNLWQYMAQIKRVLNQAYFGTPGGDTAHAMNPLYYLQAAWRELLTPCIAVLFLVLAPLSLARKPRPWIEWLWLALPFVVFSSFKTKLPYYMFGLLPAAALLMVHGIRKIPWRALRGSAVALAITTIIVINVLALWLMPRPPWFWPPPGVPHQLLKLAGGAWAQIDYPARWTGTGQLIADTVQVNDTAAVVFLASEQDVRSRAWAAVTGRRIPDKPVVMLVSPEPMPDRGIVGSALILIAEETVATPPLDSLCSREGLKANIIYPDEVGQRLRSELDLWVEGYRESLPYSMGRVYMVKIVFSPKNSPIPGS